MNFSRPSLTNAVADTALIVNSRKHERDAMKDFLIGAHYHVLSAKDRDEAMELCRSYQGKIHLLITDGEGGASGWDLAQSALRMRPGLMVMFMSQEAMEAGETPRPFEGRFTPQMLADVAQALVRRTRHGGRCN